MARDLLLELGAEEIPASFIGPALEDLTRIFTERATAKRLAHGEVRTFGTPRRLALWVGKVAEETLAASREMLGPSLKVAFDAEGAPTKAAEKFAAGHKIPAAQLLRVSTPKGEYVAARIDEKGKPALEVLTEILNEAIHGINFKKSMRWGDVDCSFARPLHWIVSLFGEDVVPLVFGDVKSGRITFGHRFESPHAIELKHPQEYERKLESAYVFPDIGKRKSELLKRIETAAQAAGGELLEDERLLEQVTNLVEFPVPVVGSFEPRHLDLPKEVLIQEMKSHQRYFSILDNKRNLLPKFIAVSNTRVKDEKLSLRGYERVLKARLADGRFFFDEDRKIPLADRVEKLKRVVWQGKLGSYWDKVLRIRQVCAFVASRLGLAEGAQIDRAAFLCKADLVTGMVGEFPELQGVMGREYAKASGEPEEVAMAIFEHYLPRGAQDALPRGDAGAIIGIADRLDTIAGLFVLGKSPTGAADPFGLRRACLGVIHVILGRGYFLSLEQMVKAALCAYEEKAGASFANSSKAQAEILEFFRARLKALWSESHRNDVVEAVLSAGFDDILKAHRQLLALSAIVGRPNFAPLAVAFKRVVNIIEKQGKDIAAGQRAQSNQFVEEAERALYSAYQGAQSRVQKLIDNSDYEGALREITGLKPAVDTFFDKVMVMAEDPVLRKNRVCLLGEIGGLFRTVADFSKIQAELGPV